MKNRIDLLPAVLLLAGSFAFAQAPAGAADALAPTRDEFVIAKAMRAASSTASPNPRLVALADNALGRRGRMNEAIAIIGRGEECFEGTPFTLELA